MEIVASILSSSVLAAVGVKLVEVAYDSRSAKRKQQREAEAERQAQAAKELVEMRKMLDDLKQEIADNREDTVALMHDRIYQAFRFLSAQETISPEDKANIDYLWERYKLAGGNHKAEIMYGIIDKIPVVATEKNKNNQEESKK